MTNKTLSILCYLTIIGWIIAYVKHKDVHPKSDLVSYHLRQGFGFFILSLLVNIALGIMTVAIPALALLNYVGILLFILWIFGIINAVNEQKKPIPLIGKIFEDKFDFVV